MNVLALFGVSLNPLTYLGSFIDDMFSAALKLFGQSASQVVTALLGFITTSSDPVFSGGWWSSGGEAVFTRVLAISGGLMALAFLLSIITALLAGDAKVLMKAVLHLPLAVIQMGLLVTVTAALLSATDEISSAIAAGASQGLNSLVTVWMIAAITNTSIVGIVLGALIILAAISVWLQLIVRSALLYIAVLGAPLIFAASVHPSVRGIQKRYIEFGIGLICSKIVVALAFATAAAALGSLGSSTSFSAEVGTLLEALAILLIACFAPYLFIRLMIGAEALLITEGLERRPMRAAMHAQQASYYLKAGGGLSGLLSGMGGAGKGGGGKSPRSGPGSAGGSNPSGGDGGNSPAGPSSGGPDSDSPGSSPHPSPPPGSTPGASSTKSGASPTRQPVPSGLLNARAALRNATSRATAGANEAMGNSPASGTSNGAGSGHGSARATPSATGGAATHAHNNGGPRPAGGDTSRPVAAPRSAPSAPSNPPSAANRPSHGSRPHATGGPQQGSATSGDSHDTTREVSIPTVPTSPASTQAPPVTGAMSPTANEGAHHVPHDHPTTQDTSTITATPHDSPAAPTSPTGAPVAVHDPTSPVTENRAPVPHVTGSDATTRADRDHTTPSERQRFSAPKEQRP